MSAPLAAGGRVAENTASAATTTAAIETRTIGDFHFGWCAGRR